MTQILVIDDDPMTQLVLKRALQKKGYDVAVASDGQEGIDCAQHLHPALIICDWMMPVMDGLAVCRWVKANPELSTTFFILLTARGALEDRVTGLDTGADEFLAKPIEIVELNSRVEAGLRLHQLSQDLQSQKQRLEAELAEAADYVRSLLPTPLEDAEIGIDARFIPSKQLGGDCYDFQWLDEDRLAIYLLDVSGHGVGAALLSVSLLNVLRSRALPDTDFQQPDRVLKALNQAFQSRSSPDSSSKYFTIWYGVYSRRDRQLVYASAGHPPAVLLKGQGEIPQSPQQLRTPGLPIGMFPDVDYTSDRCEIEPSSVLYLFSDGVYEIRQTNGDIWGLDAFADLISNFHARQCADLDRLIGEIQRLSPNRTLDDDLSILKLNF